MDEFEKRFKMAKQHRQAVLDGEGREVYKFCYNGRQIEWDNQKKKAHADTDDEIFTDFPATMAEDFAGELFTTLTPENAPWVEYESGSPVDDAEIAQQQLEVFEEAIGKEIRKSNYYDEGMTAFADAVVGNAAMWIDKPALSRPAICQAVPIAELFLRLGPNGIDDRFWQEKYSYGDLPALFPNGQFSDKLKRKIEKDSGDATVVRAYWQTFKDVENPKWRYECRVDGEPIGLDEDLEEMGQVKLVVGRFNPVAKSAWGWGPGRRTLPTIRSLNELTSMNLEGMDRTLDPAYVYPHDGFLDLSEGIESGLGYAAAPGSAEQIRALGLEGSLDYGFFSEERLEERVRDGFYRETMQRGKTPPSASQYMGEQQKQLRRIARPGAKLWQEFGVGILRRFEYLARQAGGALQGLQISLIENGDIIPRPISPLERAQAGEEVIVSQSIMAMTAETMGPQQAALLIDGPTTMNNIKRTLKDKNVEFRTEEQMKQIMQAQMPQQEAPNEAV